MIYGNIYCENFTENKLFDYSSPRNTDGLFTPYIALREKLLQLGIEVNTPDINRDRTISFEIHMDGRPLSGNNLPKYLISVENPLINKLNADIDYLKDFQRVFSWNVAALNLPGAVKILIPNSISLPNTRSYSERHIFSCLISSNKVAPWVGPNDLYAERINVIRWYEKNAPSLFHLYGRGWNKPCQAFTRKDKFLRRLGRLGTQLFGYKPFPSWQGEVQFKSGILSNTRFSYCYENVKGLPNYITEKIFDSFLSGCVPIYWGADNVHEYIPSHCFIDRRQFRGTADVHRHLMSITPEQHAQFQRNISDFLKSEQAYLFSVENFVSTIAGAIAGDFHSSNARPVIMV
ncbi:MAG: glycosyltransferase family 10 [Gallionella sp.]|nr:glycosyltransferase family 10 [Gallionella sp.]